MSHIDTSIVESLRDTHTLPDEALEELLETDDEALLRRLREAALSVKRSVKGEEILRRGLIEWSNICRNDCLYCGIRRSRPGLVRYSLSREQILDCCRRIVEAGIGTFVLQGGENPAGALELVPLVRTLRERWPRQAITLSLGELPFDTYRQLKEAGANRYLLRHESANPLHYQQLHPASMHLESRLACLQELRRLGFETGMGMMVGSPGQSTAHLVEDIRLIEAFRPEMIGIGPFIPQADTPFAQHPTGSGETTLRLISILRLMLPEANIPSTTALAVLRGGKEAGLEAGANVVMPVFTPESEKQKYDLYKGKYHV